LVSRAQALAQRLSKMGQDEDSQTVEALLLVANEHSSASRYLTTGDIARRFGVSRQTVVNWIKKGVLPGARIGGRLMVPAAAMERVNGLENLLDDLDAERPPARPQEVIDLLGRDRRGSTWHDAE
jgi:excisionase family DNA binding protein